MAFTTLVGTAVLAEKLSDPDWVVIDCRHDLFKPEAGRAEYDRSHIPGARFMQLDRDLSGEKTGRNGRHPLPDPVALASRLGAAGVTRGKQVIAYDAQDGMNAARLWWMLRWLGHDAVAVLDGGWPKWVREGRPCNASAPLPSAFTISAADAVGRTCPVANVARDGGGTSTLTGRPSRVQRSKPPSSTATASWPSQRSIHHSRDANMPLPWS